MRSYTFPSAATSDEGIGKSEAADEPSALFRPTLISSATCHNGCIAINTYPEISNDRRCGPKFWIIESGHVLAFADQSITCAGECVVIGQNLLKSLVWASRWTQACAILLSKSSNTFTSSFSPAWAVGTALVKKATRRTRTANKQNRFRQDLLFSFLLELDRSPYRWLILLVHRPNRVTCNPAAAAAATHVSNRFTLEVIGMLRSF